MQPLSRQHTQTARRLLAERGVELTPDEVERLRKDAYAHIRVEMRKLGHDVPESDEELFLMLKRLRVKFR